MLLVFHPGPFVRKELPYLLVDIDKEVPIEGFSEKKLCPTSLTVLDISPRDTFKPIFFIYNNKELTSLELDKLEQVRRKYCTGHIPKDDFVFRVITDEKEKKLFSSVLKID